MRDECSMFHCATAISQLHHQDTQCKMAAAGVVWVNSSWALGKHPKYKLHFSEFSMLVLKTIWNQALRK